MYLLMTDETNLSAGKHAEFFIYGGLIVDIDRLTGIHRAIEDIRVEHEFAPADALKFDTNSRPPAITPDQHRAAKNAVIEACQEAGTQFLVYMILHDIARKQSQDVRVSYGVNTVLASYHKFLRRKRDVGMVLVDRLPFGKGYAFLREKFTEGSRFPDGSDSMRLSDRMLAFGATSDGASHFSSAVDIVLGSFRFCVNQRGKTEVSKKLMEKVAPMIWHRRSGDVAYLRDYGLMLRPQTIRVPHYQQKYDDLVEHLTALVEDIE